ncbi:rhodanese-like domain-containing protein [Bythopirellula goksoeyrii]|uniref:Inner membrane protein YgaP n=1 Tax=Bythopirellula goksoeyrii TaxID=1400387 RepID=A0A5B9Q7X1_9BACT|nr:rhodanese-like domain-containing protein [Bythopirellula goksoeyrii]QEG33830.1 Inner membrane protein YgaP [Bythopirellula goksoeyrii]
MSYKTISPEELHDLYQQGAPIDLIDVRTPVEFREIHATPARNVPLDSLDPHMVVNGRNGNAEKPLYVICRSGSRAANACDQLVAAGYTNVVNVEGGTAAWDQLGLPVVRGKKSISLERQVRIAAGLLILVGSILGYFVNPYFIGITLFVGAGLTFAGLTDTCGMGMILAKMPWNQLKSDGPSCCTP